MLSTVPLPRLLEGIAASLRTNVALHVDDPFATMQLRAIDELLRNLALRVEWRLDDVAFEVAALQVLLATHRAVGWDDGAPSAPVAARPASVAAVATAATGPKVSSSKAATTGCVSASTVGA